MAAKTRKTVDYGRVPHRCDSLPPWWSLMSAQGKHSWQMTAEELGDWFDSHWDVIDTRSIAAGRINDPRVMHALDVCQAYGRGEEVPGRVLELYKGTEHYAAALAQLARAAAIEAGRVRWQDAPDITADDMVWEPVSRRGGAGWSERQVARSWVKGRYMYQTTFLPSPFDYGAQIEESYAVFVGYEPREVPGLEVYERECDWWVDFDTAEEAFRFAVSDAEGPKEDFLPIEVDVEKADRVMRRGYRKQYASPR